MAETLVLAELTIDPSGLITQSGAAQAALGRVGGQVKQLESTIAGGASHMNAFEHRMFSMREAAGAFLGVFTLGGAILTFKNFLEEVAKGDSAFGNFTESIKTANGQLQNMVAPFVHAGLKAMTSEIDDASSSMSGFVNRFGTAHSSLSAGAKAAFWLTLLAVTGKEGALTAAAMLPKGMTHTQTAEQMGPPGPQGYRAGNPIAQYNPSFYAPMATRVPEQQTGPIGAYIPMAVKLTEKLDDLLIPLREVNYALSNEVMGPTIAEFHQGLQDELDITISKYQQWADVVDAASGAVQAAAAAGIVSQGAAARASMIFVAAQATIRGMMELALATASAAMYDYGAAALHNVAAGLFFATAAFNVGAAFRGASGGGGRASGGNGNIAAAAPQATVQPNVTIIVQGSLLGTSKEQLARDIVTLWQKGARDQGGGQAVVSQRVN